MPIEKYVRGKKNFFHQTILRVLLLSLVFVPPGLALGNGPSGDPKVGEFLSTDNRNQGVPPEFQHEVSLAAVSGLPGTIQVKLERADVTSVRLLIEEEDRFLFLGLRPSASPGSYVLQFPTPERKFLYRFQFTHTDGSRSLSDTYEMIPHCGAREVRSAFEGVSGDERRRALIREAILLDRDVERLRYTMSVLEDHQRSISAPEDDGGAR